MAGHCTPAAHCISYWIDTKVGLLSYTELGLCMLMRPPCWPECCLPTTIATGPHTSADMPASAFLSSGNEIFTLDLDTLEWATVLLSGSVHATTTITALAVIERAAADGTTHVLVGGHSSYSPYGPVVFSATLVSAIGSFCAPSCFVCIPCVWLMVWYCMVYGTVSCCSDFQGCYCCGAALNGKGVCRRKLRFYLVVCGMRSMF